MHARAQILDAILDALESSSPAIPVYEEDETATAVPCFQYDVETEEPVEAELTKARNRSRALTLRVTARGTTMDERETLAEFLEEVLLDGALGSAFDVVLGPIAMKRDATGGQRIYSATYSLEIRYNTPRGQPGTLG